MPISYDFKTIFVHIPKNAGSSVEKYLGMGSIEQLYSRKPIKDTTLSYNKSLFNTRELFDFENVCPQHLTASQLKKVIEPEIFNSFYKFAVTGNPYHRMISEYLYVQSNGHSRYTPYKGITFDAFLDKAFSLPEEEQLVIFDGHLTLQSGFIYANGELLVDQVFTMDNIPELESRLQQLTGLSLPLPTARASPKVDKAAFLTTRNKELIYKKFETDFQFLGYNQ